MKKIFITSGIIIVAAMAISDTISNFKEVQDVAIVTPAQQNMRTPANQNPGQITRDMQTQRLQNQQSNPAWSKNPNNNANKLDNFNRNRDRDNMRQYMNKKIKDSDRTEDLWNN